MKLRTAASYTQAKCSQCKTLDEVASTLSSMDLTIECPLPNCHIYQFPAVYRLLIILYHIVYIVMRIQVLIVLYQVHLSSYKSVIFVILIICIDSLIFLLFSFAACVYSGNETKFGMNKKVPQMKLTKSDIMINWFTVLIFCFQVVIIYFFYVVTSGCYFWSNWCS